MSTDPGPRPARTSAPFVLRLVRGVGGAAFACLVLVAWVVATAFVMQGLGVQSGAVVRAAWVWLPVGAAAALVVSRRTRAARDGVSTGASVGLVLGALVLDSLINAGA